MVLTTGRRWQIFKITSEKEKNALAISILFISKASLTLIQTLTMLLYQNEMQLVFKSRFEEKKMRKIKKEKELNLAS